MTIEPFSIDIPSAALDDLRARVERTRWPHVLDPASDRHGPSLARMRRLRDRLLVYDGRALEAALNRVPQFATTIDRQRVHFVHVRSRRAGAVPLLVVHGWPGSFADYLDVLAPLSASFHVVVPSLPGVAFSGPTTEAGWNTRRIARAFLELMTRLGYDRFAVQGADVGAIVGPELARLAPERVIGVHVNAATLGFIPLGPVDPSELATFTPAERERLDRLRRFLDEQFGFNQLQSQQPQLVAYALADSPIGLLAWMSQLFGGRGLEDHLLRDFFLYWVTGTAASSIRLYYEDAHDPEAWVPKPPSGVPTAVAVFQEGDVAIRRFAEPGHTIVRWREYATGGHHAVLEVPDVWLADVREFIDELCVDERRPAASRSTRPVTP